MSLNLDVQYQGQIFNDTSAVETLTLDVQHLGRPFLGVYNSGTTPTPLNLTLLLMFNH